MKAKIEPNMGSVIPDADEEFYRDSMLIITPESENEKIVLREWLKANEHDRVCTNVEEGEA